MFDYLRNLTKSAEEKQQEALNAYLDDTLSPKERQRFEQLLAHDADLRQEVEQYRALQAQMRQMPRRRVPRNFTLDPAVYGRPQRQPLFQLYPTMRVAAVMTAIFFILAIGADLFLSGGSPAMLSAPQDVAMFEEAAGETTVETAVEAPLAAQAVEVTRAVTEEVTEGEAAAEAAPLIADTAVAGEMEQAVAEEEMIEAAAEVGAPVEATPQPSTDAVENFAEDNGEPLQEPAAAPLPTGSPAPTQTALAALDATKSTVPRPEAAATAGERAVAATTQAEVANGAVQIEVTAVPTPQPKQQPISGLRWLQIGLGLLLIVLLTAVFYVRRHTI